MRVWGLSLCLFTVQIGLAYGRAKGRIHGDFEFEDQVSVREESRSGKEGKKSWILDPQSDLCQALKCDVSKELCLLEDEFTAVCVSKTDLQRNGNVILPKGKAKAQSKEYDEDEDYYEDEEDEDDDDDDNDLSGFSFHKEISRPSPKVQVYKSCPPCPVTRPIFLCGSDNRTYSSLCRLDYHNCIQEAKITAECKGFCPCKTAPSAKVGLNLKKQTWELRNSLDKKMKESHLRKEKMDTSRSLPAASYSHSGSRFSVDSDPNKAQLGVGKWNKKVSSDKARNHNEVINTKSAVRVKECGEDDLASIGSRLLDWFSVIRKDVKKLNSHRTQSPPECKSAVRWMFDYLNVNGDEHLSLEELVRIENGRVEECVGAFIEACDLDKNDQTTSTEWCRCFDALSLPDSAPPARNELLDDEDNTEGSADGPLDI